MKKHSKALVFFAVSKQIPIVYSADRGRAEIKGAIYIRWKKVDITPFVFQYKKYNESKMGLKGAIWQIAPFNFG